jgi:hypothetical protein
MTDFATRQREAFIDAACEAARARQALYRTLREVLRIDGRQHLGDVVELDSTTTLAEVHGTSFGTVWRVVADGKALFSSYPSRSTAVLAAVGSWHDAGNEAWGYAARVLQVPIEVPTE